MRGGDYVWMGDSLQEERKKIDIIKTIAWQFLLLVSMRIMARVNAFLPSGHVDEDSDLREVISRIASSIRFNSQPVWRRCNTRWWQRLRTMKYNVLRRELRFLLSHSGFRRIAIFYDKFFHNARSALMIAGEFVTEIGMQNAKVFARMMTEFREQCGEYIFF